MGSTFNPQILVEKLAKLNNSQASIETLSHWCIFHMTKAKQVVETWDRQFHSSPPEQRLAFLYLANDILQNSRRKGSEFVGEFWNVLPDALRDVIQNGDELGRNSALRLIGIWEERKVFGSRGQILKEEFGGRHMENSNRSGKPMNFKLRSSAGNALEKIVSSYHGVYGGQMDEDTLLSKCRNAIICLEKVHKEIGGDSNSDQLHGSALVDELQGQNAVLRDCIEQLTAIESSRASLVSHLRDALQDQEFKLDQVRNQIQAAQAQSDQAGNICRQLDCSNVQAVAEHISKETHPSIALPAFMPGDREQSAPVMYTQQVPFPEKSGRIEEDPRKSAAAAVAAKLTASTSSAQMLSYVLSSLASEGVIGNPLKESPGNYHSEKRTKLENDQSSYIPSESPQQRPVPPFPHPESLQLSGSTTNKKSTPNEPPPPPSSSPPPLPPPPPILQYPLPQFPQTTASMTSVSYSYSLTQQQQHSIPAYLNAGSQAPFATPMNSYQGFQGSDGNYYNQPSSMPAAPISRQ
ncbi:Regulation of nuclear pre-mRNA domain-containing protein 1B [Quillaja saponaria]|uniref:Regulation of nuclear pre-mRNA domain-containing protein 1B n=1 Tax=Quillaja saponaria TaxID=32244 RepID=A0AAD7Q7F8_QUISA|nr:Regulation of nuclear pre-mRNA domain-containing protein 1B [Quillaja saponaria]KAJ7976264.1 Regulation of nuclear pre-mRNA domain-containing protein 1B [Quillaja saponaria]